MSLSIFSFKNSDGRSSQPMQARAGWQQSEPGVAVLDGAPEQHCESGMLLDLEHLTPEVIEKFFPSESTLAAGRR